MTTVFKQVGPYHIVRQIGHGGMAVVFLATDTRNDRQVALKLVQHGPDRELREIVEAEQFGAELQQRFAQSGAHVPAVYEQGLDEDSGYFYVAMEYLDGENLSEVIARGPLPAARAVDIAIDVARFLEEAHSFQAVVNGRNLQSLLHLDLKPRNVRITSGQQVKILDFGTAKALSLSRKVTRNDFGSVAYLSPERLETGQVDAHADLWALGVVLYEMVRGVPPFQAEDTRRLERLILSRRPPVPLVGECAVGLQAIVARLLDPVAANRYSTAREIRDDLERFKSEHRPLAEEQGWPARAYSDDATRRTRPVEDAADQATRRTRPPTVAAVVSSSIPPPIPPPLPRAQEKPPPAVAAAKKPPSMSRRLLRAGLLLIALAITTNECSVATSARRVANGVSTQSFEQLPDSWSEYERLSERSYLHFATVALEHSLVDRTFVLADRVIANYRTPSPTVREAQWAAARDALARALTLGGGDPALRAALRYCEGHLHRINGEAKKARHDLDGARSDLTDAVVAFREAAELRRGWADPFIGLARTFVVGLEDVERGADALNQAQQHGYQPSNREFAQLGDGYRARGNALVRSAREVAGLPQEREYLTRAADAYREALSFYSRTGEVPGVPQNVGRTQRTLAQIEEGLGEKPAPPPPEQLASPVTAEPSPPAVPPPGPPSAPSSPESASLQDGAPWQ